MKPVGVECRDVHLAYGGTEVLKGVSLSIAPGEFFALLGPSGSGKSTLLRAIAGFARHQSGSLLIDGVDMSAQAPWQRQVGLVFQSYALWPHLSVWDNVAFGLVERKVEKAALRSRVGAALEMVSLTGLAQRRPNELSGGQQQRVALARTLVIEPQVLLLDEPLSNLDKSLRVQMRQELLALQRRLQLTTIFVTHDQEEAMTTADRLAVLDQGVLQQVGTPEQLYDEPANAFVAGFVGTMNLLVVRGSHAQQLEVEGLGTLPWSGALTDHSNGNANGHTNGDTNGDANGDARGRLLACRPHTLVLRADEEGPGDATRLWRQARVQHREYQGAATRYGVRLGDSLLWVDQPHVAGVPRRPEGAAVWLGFDPAQLRLLPA